MFQPQWIEIVEQTLKEIETNYPNSPLKDRQKWKGRFRQLKKSCDQLLESWSAIEERVAQLIHEHPELISDEKEVEEEFWIHESVVRQFRQGQGYFNLTMFHEAKDLFHQVVHQEPDFLLGRVYLGLSQFHAGELEESANHFHLVIRTTTQDVFVGFATHMLGCIEVKQGNDQQAIKYFRKVISIIPDHSDSWFNLGTCYYRMGEYHEAIPHFYHALNINEHDWESMHYLSNCYRHYREWGSVNFWRMASYEKTHHPMVMISIAHDYEEMGEHDKAIDWYRKLTSNQEHRFTAYHGIAWNFWAKHDANSALLWLKKGLTLDPRNPNLLFMFAWISFLQGEDDKVEKVLSSIPIEAQKQPNWIAMRSRLSTKAGKTPEAIQIAEEMIEQEQSSSQAMGHYQKGRVLLEMGQIPEAIEQFQEAHSRLKSWRDPIFYQGICHLIEGRSDLMQQCWKEICLSS
ncbi:tetratricopeptide repeat protein [Thermoactinomyces sp. DSM 45892]|uniref:tetratricopeptide repeat protein n=1 Tax=Thermoactinomyces sp. DSM 45892 TaxID=1882753 RepID=UPI00089558FF|nr:tetratricopeptide repeat protein [Thermoactinomyces sp. DSM 45892]SDY98381.1 Tetratricopeptide (TPR) repeat [Thermoactinomyces sp. DSM 45892]